MSLLLKNVYENTKKKFKLDLVCGEKGLQNLIDWIYISENIETLHFLKGGELVLTTGYCIKESPHWLYDYISLLIERSACGLIINIGEYVQPSHLTTDIIDLCNEHSFPVFFMPWEILFYDITKEYCNRIYQDNQKVEAVSNAFLRLTSSLEQLDYYSAILEEQGYLKDRSYTLCYLSLPALDNSDDYHSLTKYINRYLHTHYGNFCLCNTMQHLLVIAPDTSVFSLKTVLKNLSDQIQLFYPGSSVTMGIGTRVSGFSDLKRSFFFAKSAAQIASAIDTPIRAFEDLGFAKILLSVNDRTILEDFRDQKLSHLFDYDAKHDSNYTETLKEYLYCNGSVQRMADHLFCHRNTINYRIHFLKEELALCLEDMNERFEYMVAFQIDSYLKNIGV